MRLINVATLRLEEFFGENIPPYAILSHTWRSSKEELSYEDINTSPVPQKQGLQKIKYLCNQAAKDGLSWAWCDTCCIDKSSSAELSEAINSMFKWYENAVICYAYLSDVPATGSAEEQAERFCKSRWFTRGWTLQELLAPMNVNFYVQDWRFFGTKQDLFVLLKKATGINTAALSWPWSIKSYCVANKMSWASKRVTTRLEDQAYCMLGILGVHIPLLYGEGQNAFRRLQEELIRSSDDESVFAHSGPNMLAESPAAFNIGYNVISFPGAIVGLHSKEPVESRYYPFTVTNMGINIHLRLISQDSTSKIYGVLNCRDAFEYEYFFAIPLRPTSLRGVYARAPGDLQRITEGDVLDARFHATFIRQVEPSTTSVTCYLKSALAGQYNIRVSGAAGMTWTTTPDYRRVILYINPRAPHDLQELNYAFQAKSHSFKVKLLFDLVENRARVSIGGRKGDQAIEMQGQSGPDSAELDMNTIESGTVRARIEPGAGQMHWLLTVSNEREIS